MALSASQIGLALKDAREAAGLSQAAAAARIGVDPQTISRYERGERRAKRPTLAALAALYGKPISAFGESNGLGNVPRDTGRPDLVAEQTAEVPYKALPRHLTNLPLPIRVYLDELRLRLTKGGSTEEEVDRAMQLLRSPSLFVWFSTGSPRELSPEKVVQAMKAIADSVIIPELRERGRKV